VQIRHFGGAARAVILNRPQGKFFKLYVHAVMRVAAQHNNR
jgi:hypothetical protein